ncbi:ECs_2282 family putative zinc-binding protein [Paraburkholderia sp. EB58]|uniref:ECs_2282 family putative zinc-binding protein n=1 Tax=Paraburkholderia sp. EB58 TaxID=3035125 RepID=UPI003D1F0A63
MTDINLGTANIQCPHCGSTQFVQQETAGPEDVKQSGAVCAGCGKHLSPAELDIEVDKIGKALQQAVADALRKALK